MFVIFLEEFDHLEGQQNQKKRMYVKMNQEDDVEESRPAPEDEEEEKDYGDAEEDLYEAEYEYDKYEYDEY